MQGYPLRGKPFVRAVAEFIVYNLLGFFTKERILDGLKKPSS